MSGWTTEPMLHHVETMQYNLQISLSPTFITLAEFATPVELCLAKPKLVQWQYINKPTLDFIDKKLLPLIKDLDEWKVFVMHCIKTFIRSFIVTHTFVEIIDGTSFICSDVVGTGHLHVLHTYPRRSLVQSQVQNLTQERLLHQICWLCCAAGTNQMKWINVVEPSTNSRI